MGTGYYGFGSFSAVKNSTRFFKTLRAQLRAAPLPIVTMAGDGEVMFVWRGFPFYLSISFFDDGTLSLYGEEATGEEYFLDNIPAGSTIPEAIRSVIMSGAPTA